MSSVRTQLLGDAWTTNESTTSRLALVLGVDAPDARNAERHDFQITRRYYDTLPVELRTYMTCRLADELEPIVQAHTFEELVTGETT